MFVIWEGLSHNHCAVLECHTVAVLYCHTVTHRHTNCHPPTVVRCTLFKPRGEDRNLGKIQKMEDGMGKGLGSGNEGAVN